MRNALLVFGWALLLPLVQLSSRTAKDRFEPIDSLLVLEKVRDLPIQRWSYRSDSLGARHLGPMAEDFFSAFGLGVDERGVSTVDSGGVALVAIQGLDAELDGRISELRQQHAVEIATLEARLAELERMLAAVLDD